MDNNVSETKNKDDNDILKLQLEKQIAFTQWIQAIGVLPKLFYSLNYIP